MNPYESTNPTFIKDTSIRSRESERIGVYLIQSLLILSLVACLFYDSVPWVRNWARPRFGSVGLFFIGNPVILLMLTKPSRVAFVLSAIMFLSMGFLSARLLLQIGTVSVVANQFTDRFHTSWLWCVAPCLIAGTYMAWLAARALPSSLQLNVGEQTDGCAYWK